MVINSVGKILFAVLIAGYMQQGSAVATAISNATASSQIYRHLIEKDPVRDFVHTKTDAFMMLPPEFICGPQIQQVSWSTDGVRLVVLRANLNLTPDVISSSLTDPTNQTNPEPETEIYTWSALTQKVAKVFHVRSSEVAITDINWVSGSSSLVFEGTDSTDPANPINRIYLISNSGATKLVATEPANQDAIIYPNPVRPVVALVSREFPQKVVTGDYSSPANASVVRFFGTDGVLSGAIKLPSARSLFRWSQNGTPYVLTFNRDQKTSKTTRQWYLLSQRDQSIKPSDAPAEFTKNLFQERKEPLVVENGDIPLPGNSAKTNASIITIRSEPKSDGEYGLVTSDGSRGELAPGSTAVAYQSQGNAMVRRLLKVPLSAYVAATTAALRGKLLNNAKQVALSLIMYASDNNDNLPANNQNWKNAIDPYLKNMPICDGFNYTCQGGNMTKFESPATTVLGYFDGPGGRAVAYSDGHCKWVPNP